MIYRVRVTMTTERGNPREIVAICETPEKRDRFLKIYQDKDRYPEADVFVEEVTDGPAPEVKP